MGRIIILSDIHISPTHGFFWENWRIARDFANRALRVDPADLPELISPYDQPVKITVQSH